MRQEVGAAVVHRGVVRDEIGPSEGRRWLHCRWRCCRTRCIGRTSGCPATIAVGGAHGEHLLPGRGSQPGHQPDLRRQLRALATFSQCAVEAIDGRRTPSSSASRPAMAGSPSPGTRWPTRSTWPISREAGDGPSTGLHALYEYAIDGQDATRTSGRVIEIIAAYVFLVTPSRSTGCREGPITVALRGAASLPRPSADEVPRPMRSAATHAFLESSGQSVCLGLHDLRSRGRLEPQVSTPGATKPASTE